MQRHVVLAASVFVVIGTGCDLFGIRCNADTDCPTDVPFCNIGVCSAVDGPVRAEGEGEDGSEGQGGAACDDDADCGTGLCYDAASGEAHFEASLVGTCVPGPAVDAACVEADFFGERQSGGQAITSASASPSTGSCASGQIALTFEVAYFDREGDGPKGDGGLLVLVPGGSSPSFETASVSSNGDEKTGVLFAGFGSSCYPDDIDHVIVAVGQTSPTSHGVCVPIGAAP